MQPWERRPVTDSYHVYSDGTRQSVLFEDPADKVFCMNLIALTGHLYGITLLCPIVMDTHFHIVLQGTGENVHCMVIQMKRQISLYLSRRGKRHLVKEGIWVEYEPIADDIELMQKIIYVFRNDLDSGGPLLPEDYPWGAGPLFFHGKKDPKVFHRVSGLSLNERRKIFHTRTDFPSTWLYDDNGMILPQCYLDRQYVMTLFGSPRRFLAFLFVKKKDLADMDEQNARRFIERRRDAELHAAANEESLRVFNRKVYKLTQAEKLELAKILWQKKLTLSRKQLARAVQMTPSIIEAVFH